MVINTKYIKTSLLLAILFGFVFFTSSIHAQLDNPQSGSTGLSGLIPSPPPTVGATISVPTSGQVFTSVPIQVSGICPDGLIVRLYRNDIFSGSVNCSDGSWTILTDLFPGANQLLARVFDALEQPGPDSNTVSVTYSDDTITVIGERLVLLSDFAVRGANPGSNLTWPLIISGGAAPYAIKIDWGNGEESLISRAQAGQFSATAVYARPGVYRVIVQASDANGQGAYLQVLSIAQGEITDQDADEASTQSVTASVSLLWPVISMFLMVVTTFFIGRRYEKRQIKDMFLKRNLDFDKPDD